MTLEELANVLYAADNYSKMFVFDEESCFDAFVKDGLESTEGGLICAVITDLHFSLTVNEKLCSAQVRAFSATKRDEIAVWIEDF